MQSCPCHRNTISEPMPMLEGPRQLTEVFAEIFGYLDDLGDDYLIERMNQAERLAHGPFNSVISATSHRPGSVTATRDQLSTFALATGRRLGRGIRGCGLGWGGV